jgi:hypothetical protein
MADFGVPPKAEYKDIPSDIYEVASLAFEEVPNNFYDPEKDNPTKATQLKWSVVLREDGELQGQKLVYYTSSYIGRHKKNKLTNLVRILDPGFDIDKAYKSEDDFRAKVLMRPFRVTTDTVEKKGDNGETKVYAKITGVLPSKLGDLTETEKLFLSSERVRPF